MGLRSGLDGGHLTTDSWSLVLGVPPNGGDSRLLDDIPHEGGVDAKAIQFEAVEIDWKFVHGADLN